MYILVITFPEIEGDWNMKYFTAAPKDEKETNEDEVESTDTTEEDEEDDDTNSEETVDNDDE